MYLNELTDFKFYQNLGINNYKYIENYVYYKTKIDTRKK